MTRYADNWTGKYMAQYRAFGESHWVSARVARGVAGVTPAILEHLTSAATAIRTYLPRDFAWLNAKFRPSDGIVFAAATIPNQVPDVGTLGYDFSEPINILAKAGQLTVPRTSAAGNQGFFTFIGVNIQAMAVDAELMSATYRITPTQLGAIGTFIAALEAMAARGANNLALDYATYANIGLNDEVVRDSRN